VRFDGSEGVNELFEWRLEAVSAEGDLDFDALIGKHATLTLNGVNGRKRKFGNPPASRNTFRRTAAERV
jgi:type VI secretion system secreted protein VgrG